MQVSRREAVIGAASAWRQAWLLVLLGFVQLAGAAQSLPFSLSAPFVATAVLDLSDTERRWLEQRKVLRVGIVTLDNEPIDITTDRNRYQGISADYLSLVRHRLGLPMQLTGFTQRDEAIAALRNGSIDILSSAAGFERGQAGMAFSRPYVAERSVVVGSSRQPVLPHSLAGRKVAMLDDYADLQAVHAAYPDSEIVLAPTLYSALEALSQGEVDAFIGNEIVVRAYLVTRPYLDLQIQFESALVSQGVAFAVRADEQPLLVLVNLALADIEPVLQREVLGRWTAGLDVQAGVQRVALNSLERNWQARHPRISVSATEHPPYIYRDAQGQWVGLNVDVLARISRMTGLQFIYHPMPSTQASLNALRKGEVQMNTTLAENAERKVFLDFTYSFGGNHWVFVLRNADSSPLNLAGLAGQVLALPAGHALESEIRSRYPDIRLYLVDTYAQAREAVESGQAYATIQNEAGAYLFPAATLKVGRSVDVQWSPDRFSVIKSHPQLLSILNKALEEFPVAEMRAIRMKWLGASLPQPSLWSRVPSWLVWSVLLAVSLAVVSLAWASRLRIQIRRRQQVEAELNDQLAFKRALFDAIPMPLYVRDLQGRLLSCNRRYEHFFDASAERLLGRRLIDIDLIPRPLAEQMHADYLHLLEHRQPLWVERTLALSGRHVEAWQWSVPLFAADGRLQGLLGGWVDVSECKGLERQLEQAEQRQARMAHEADAIVELLAVACDQAQSQRQIPLETLLSLQRLLQALISEGQPPSGRQGATVFSLSHCAGMLDQ